MPAQVEVLQDTLDRFVTAWSSWHAPDMTALLTDDCTQVELPFSLGHTPRSRADIDRTLPKLSQIVTNFNLRVHELVLDPIRGKAVIYALSTGNTPAGDWTHEHAMFLTFNENGTLIAKLEEMIDSAYMKEFYPKFSKCLRGEDVNGTD